MPRIVKHPAERRAELLDIAQRLFFERGYEQTTVNDIIAAAGISKGAFYHYFASKEELLAALAQSLAEESLAQTGDILNDQSLNALERLNAFFAASRQIKRGIGRTWQPVFGAAYQPANLVLYHQLATAGFEVVGPIVTRVIQEGVEAGLFDTPDPAATAELILTLLQTARQSIVVALAAETGEELNAAIAAVEARLRFCGIAIDRILRLPDGSIQLTDPGFAKAVLSPDLQEHDEQSA